MVPTLKQTSSSGSCTFTSTFSSSCEGEFCVLVRTLDPKRDLHFSSTATNSSHITSQQSATSSFETKKLIINNEENSNGSNRFNISKTQQEMEGRDRAYRIMEKVLAQSELKRLEENGKLIRLSITQKIHPFERKHVPLSSISMSKKEHRRAFLDLAIVEDNMFLSDQEWEELVKTHSSLLHLESDGFESIIQQHHDHMKKPSEEKEGDVAVCMVCFHVYRLLNKVRLLLSEQESKKCNNDRKQVNEDPKVLICNDNLIQKQPKSTKRKAQSPAKNKKSTENINKRIDIDLDTFKKELRANFHSQVESHQKERSRQLKEIKRMFDEPILNTLPRQVSSKNNSFKKAHAKVIKSQDQGIPQVSKTTSSNNNSNYEPTAAQKGNYNVKKNTNKNIHKKSSKRNSSTKDATRLDGNICPNTISGNLQYDSFTSFPYTILDSSFSLTSVNDNSEETVKKRRSVSCMNMIICQDLFDTSERYRILLSPIADRNPGVQILIWNYPGQAFTTYNQQQSLNNEFHAACLDKLLAHIGECGTSQFDTTTPFFIMGHGYGGSIATLYSARYRCENLKGLLLVNPLSFVDPFYASAIHDCRNVFSCSPESRPDLPVYFYSRFLFSQNYLEKVSTALALNLYTAVHNPITLRGRIDLCSGVLNNIDIRPMVKNVVAPIITMHGNESGLVRAVHAVSFIEGRICCSTVGETLTKGGKRTVVLATDGGHELLQEKKRPFLVLIQQLLNGSNDGDAIQPYVDEPSLIQKEDTTNIDNDSGKTKLQEKYKKKTSKVKFTKQNEDFELQNIRLILDPHDPAFERQMNQIYKPNNASQSPQQPQNEPGMKNREYISWRLSRNKKILLRYQKSAKVIQCAFRVYMAKTMFKRIQRQSSALMIERCYRGMRGRRYFLKCKKELWAVRFIQRIFRGSRGRCEYNDMLRACLCQITLARRWRGLKARRIVLKIIHNRHVGAISIQKLWRRYKAISTAFMLRNRRNACIDIQRIYRGYMGRNLASNERDKLVFSLSQNSGLELGRKMLVEHKLQATKLQSELNVINDEKEVLEKKAGRLIEEINSFESTVQQLEKSMQQLSMIEIGSTSSNVMDYRAQALQEKRVQLDKEFSSILVKITDRKKRLQELQSKLSSLAMKHNSKTNDLKMLERKLVVLLEAQESNLLEIRKRQERQGDYREKMKRQSLIINQNNNGSNHQHMMSNTEEESNRHVAQLMESTESMMKFGFASMAMTYFTSLNTVRAVKASTKSGDSINKELIIPALVNKNTKDHMQRVMKETLTNKSSSPTLITNNKNDKDEDSVKFWNVDDVLKWLSAICLSQYSNAFKEAAIDGPFLSQLTDEDLRNVLGVEHKLHRKKILFSISQLLGEKFNGSTPMSSPMSQPMMLNDNVITPIKRESIIDNNITPRASSRGNDNIIQIDNFMIDTHENNSIGGSFDATNRTSSVKKERTDSIRSLDKRKYSSYKSRKHKYDEDKSIRTMTSFSDIKTSSSKMRSEVRVVESDSFFDESLSNMIPKNLEKAYPKVRFEDLATWIRNQKLDLIREALDTIPDEEFDKLTLRVQYVDGEGTAYERSVEVRTKFHINQVDEYGNTLLHIAAQNGNVKIGKLLVAKGANVNHQNKQGQTAGHFAVAYRFWDFASWIFDVNGGGGNDLLLNIYGMGPYDGLNPSDDGL